MKYFRTVSGKFMWKFAPSFDEGAIRNFLEAKLGEFKSFDLIVHCSRPENFCAVTQDGRKLLVKCIEDAPGNTSIFIDHFLQHVKDLKDEPRVTKLVGGPWQFNGQLVTVFSWCEGVSILPNKLSAAQEENLVKAYKSFSRAIQNANGVMPEWCEIANKYDIIIDELKKLKMGPLIRFFEKYIPRDAVVIDNDKTIVVHGDMHSGNFHFVGDDVSGIFDLEAFKMGYAAEDWVRYIIAGAEHLRWFDYAGRNKIVSLFKRLQPLATPQEWRYAVAAFLILKLHNRLSRRKGSKLKKLYYSLKIFFRLPFYRSLFELIPRQNPHLQPISKKSHFSLA